MSDLGRVAPHTGARIRLVLRETRDEEVAYDLLLSGDDMSVQARLTVALVDGNVQGLPAEPEWLCKLAGGLLRVAYRQRESSGWSRRITRWRAARGS
jgi:hypothetical protein